MALAESSAWAFSSQWGSSRLAFTSMAHLAVSTSAPRRPVLGCLSPASSLATCRSCRFQLASATPGTPAKLSIGPNWALKAPV